MMPRLRSRAHKGLVLAAGGLALSIAPVGAQDRLKAMPGYDQYAKMQPQLAGAVVSGAITPTWEADGRGVSYATGGKLHRFDLRTMVDAVTGDAPATPAGGRSGGQGRQGGQGAAAPAGPTGPGCPPEQVDRGRQASCLMSPDGKVRAQYKDRNLWIMNPDGSNAVQVTTDGDERARIKYAIASWVYGEELGQRTAMWWSPDSTRLGFYRFDESHVKDFYLQTDQTKVQDSLNVEAYPKPGAPNPIADVLVYDVAAKRTTPIDVRDGQPFDNSVVGHYVYNIRWSPDGTELLMDRANRRQQIVEFTACNPADGKCRVIVREEWPTGWLNTDGGLRLQWLKDGKRFILASERNGWDNYYLYDLTGKLINPITTHTTFESGAILRIDEAAGVMFYMARDGDNYMKMQLHRVGLDGTDDRRLTDPKFNHAVNLSPDNKYFTDVYQTHDQPPATALVDVTGKVIAELAKSDTTKFDQLGLKKAEQYTYLAADGTTKLYGQISFPSTFDPNKKYPTLIAVYGGPAAASNVPTETFANPNAATEYGFLVVSLSSRAVPGMGKRALDALYLKLGVTEMDDMAEGIRALWGRPYFDRTRVGMYGTSYGGYTAATMILRHPDVVAAASASSPPTAWYNYDTIYTERYMWLPEDNKDGYEAGNDMNYAKDLKGRLLLYYGTADNNVHQTNVMQLIKALQAAGKSFEVQVGPDQGHSGVNNARMMEFFIECLVMHPEELMFDGRSQ
jgi:dipeptidyl-peptidase-4